MITNDEGNDQAHTYSRDWLVDNVYNTAHSKPKLDVILLKMDSQGSPCMKENHRRDSKNGKEETITKSSGPWCSPIVLVRKKVGTIHFWVDYRNLNDVIHKDAYPLPRIVDILDALRGAKYFFSIDLARSYWQIKVAGKDQKKTAIGSHLGLYEFLCMPFGF